ncbi:peptide MFS transporter [Sphingomonas sp. MMS24-J13]|uniref:peptide MFS transporter n=1 Tax=Sphingomonas sp. MMS24-J13 TaxID=3238686 RepID=UPI00384E9772
MTSPSAETLPGTKRSLFGHPPGLTILFLTQMWAEFSYFGLQALLVYYMTQQLGFPQAKSSMIYGIYGGAAFFSPFFGGMIADKWLGRTRSVVIGGLLMMCGHFAMAFPGLLFPALALVAIGNGLFMPPLAVQVGSLYADDDPRKAHAFSAYYMGINLGGLLAPLVCGTLGEMVGWHWGFAAAGIGMLFGLIVYLGFRRLLPADPRTARAEATAPAIPIDRRNVRLLMAIVAVVILFRIGYEQSGNVIALWVKDFTDRSLFGGAFTIPATWFQAINPLLIIVLTPLLIRHWGKRAERAGPLVQMRRMSLGCVIASASMLVMVLAAMVAARTGQPVSAWWTIVYFLLLTIGELLVIPVGLALVDMLSPAGFAATAMGAWYIAKFLGSVLAGMMGSYWGDIPATLFFAIGAAAVLVAAGILRLMGKPALQPA